MDLTFVSKSKILACSVILHITFILQQDTMYIIYNIYYIIIVINTGI